MPLLHLFLGFLLMQTSKPASVSGIVTNAVSGAPLRKTRLFIFQAGHDYVAVSDASGKFAISEVAPGTYNVRAECDGFQAAAQSITLVEDQHLDDMALRLNPFGVIAGKVVDENGEPLAQISVEAQVDQFTRNGLVRGPGGVGMTDDRGEYRIFDLPAGRYYLKAGSPRAFSSIGGRIHGDAVETAYVDTWFPNVTDPSQAPVNVLAPGAEVSGIDIHMRKERVFHIRGKVALPPGQRTSLEAAVCGNAITTGVSVPVLRDGTFDSGGIQPGNWCLTVHAIVDASHSYYARQMVAVADHDVNNVAMAVVPAGEVRGQILVDGAPPNSLPHIPVRLDPIEAPGRATGSNADDTGTFGLQNVAPGAYRLMDVNLSGMYLKAVRLNDQEVSAAAIQIPQGGARLTLLFSTDVGALSGKVEGSGSFVSAEPVVAPGVIPAAIGIRPDGSFQFQNLAPGDYKVVAWDMHDLGPLQYAGFRRLFDGSAVTVTVHPKGRETVQLKVVPAAEIEAAIARLR